IGITFVTRLAPALAISQLIILFVSVALMVGTLALVKNLDVVMRYKYTFGIIGIILLMLPIFIGTTISGSKLWIRIAGFTIQ
ncbi:FtsW/RodA/SpoVE family cell cycle protein, partial [Streptococcus gordonii]|nr:FtsW/RodA/SpoVE family cell cycle protein [Streptococcus gordonii]